MLKMLRGFFSTLVILVTPAAVAEQLAIAPLVRIVVPFSPGASTDVIARSVASQLGPRLGTSVIVENRPGASGFIGASAVAKGPRDGSMLLFTSVSMLTAAATMKNAPIDVVKDLDPISILAEGPMVIAVSTRTNIERPADLVATARAKPDTITHGTGGIGTLAHLAAELLNNAAWIQIRHIPYKGASLAVADLAGGTIDAMIAVNTTFASQIKAGRVRPIAITSLEPNPAFPGLPAMASVAPGYEVNLWTAMFAPAGTAAPLIQRLNREINEIMRSKQLLELMSADGAVALSLTPEEAAALVRQSFATWKQLATEKNIVAE